jgi:hypothetical protein
MHVSSSKSPASFADPYATFPQKEINGTVAMVSNSRRLFVLLAASYRHYKV